MAVATAVDFKAETKRLFKRFDQLDVDALREMFADDAQGVDELSRKWLRGRPALERYMAGLQKMGVSDITSKLRGIRVETWNGAALVTCMLDQTYTVGGETMTIEAPTTVLFRRTHSDWRVALIHTVPFPTEG